MTGALAARRCVMAVRKARASPPLAYPLYVADAFTQAKYTGNAAGVVVLASGEDGDDGWMADVAAEMKHSETAFVWPVKDNEYGLRWFTPGRVEVDLCGHATVAGTAAICHLRHRGDEAAAITFHTKSGELGVDAKRTSDDGTTWSVRMDFPAAPATALDDEARASAICAAVGVPRTLASFVGRTALNDDLLVVLDADDEYVRKLQPDMSALMAEAVGPHRGVIVAAASSLPDVDFVSRFWGPRVGIEEDPVTGSAHCSLAPYWDAGATGKPLKALQLSERRGELTTTCKGDRVVIEGDAVVVLAGTLL